MGICGHRFARVQIELNAVNFIQKTTIVYRMVVLSSEFEIESIQVDINNWFKPKQNFIIITFQLLEMLASAPPSNSNLMQWYQPYAAA